MRIVYLVNIDTRVNGGLNISTIERIIRLQRKIDILRIINCNFYDGMLYRIIKSIKFKRRDVVHIKPSKEEIGDVGFDNLNHKIAILSRLFSNKYEFTLSYLDKAVEKIALKYMNDFLHTDIFHAHWGWPNGYIAYKLAKMFNKNYNITFHGSDIRILDTEYKNYLILAMNNADICYFVSTGLLEIAKSKGYQGSNAKVSYNGVDLSRFTPMKKKENKKVIGFIGALERIKGADYLPKIYDYLSKNLTEPVEFLVVGDGALKVELEEVFKCEPNVKFFGRYTT